MTAHLEMAFACAFWRWNHMARTAPGESLRRG
jgi:hypothetical protein